MNNDEITRYFGSTIETLIKDILKHTARNPKETAFFMKFINSGRKAHKRRTKHEREGMHIPAFMITSITADCNLDCKGCYAKVNSECGSFAKKVMLSDDRWGEIFREAAEIGISFVLVAGGEPLLRKEILLRAAKVKDIIFPVFTNGMLIDEGCVKLFDKNRNLIPVISLEGNCENTDLRRGAGIYSKVISVMEDLQKSGILFGSSVTVTALNQQEVSSFDFIHQLYEKSCRIIFYNEYVPAEENTDHLVLTEGERASLDRNIEKIHGEWPDMVIMSFPGDEKFTGGCLAAGRGFFHVNPYGCAEPCPFSPFSDMDLKENCLLDVLRSPLFEKINNMDLDCGEHAGGCALFAKRNEVRQLFNL